MRQILVLLALQFVVSTCNMPIQDDNGIILIDSDKQYPELDLLLQDIADIKFVKLEGENEKCFINEISSDVYFDEPRKQIIIGKTLKAPFFIAIFDGEGHFLRQIGHRGLGPGEYIDNIQFAYNESEDIITIWNYATQKIIQYYSTGEFIRELAMNHFVSTYTKMLSINNSLVFYNAFSQVHYPDINKYKEFGWTFKAFDLLSLEEVPIQDHHYGRIMAPENVTIPTTGICKTEDGYLLSCARSDTTYLLDTNLKLRPFLVDIRHNIERGFILKPTLETKDYLFLHLTPPADGKHPNEHRYFAIRRSDHKVFSCGGNTYYLITNINSLSINEYFQSLTSGYGKYIIYKSYVPQPPNPDYPIPKEVETLAKEMDDESNPILMIIQLKR